MDQLAVDSALESQPHETPLIVTVAVIVGAGLFSWAVVLSGLYFAWHAIRGFLA
jgi:hypothetical protein